MGVSNEISLVMTVLNEGTNIRRLLESVERQTVPPAEIVVVDGGSTDDTVAEIRSWGSVHQIPTRVIEQPGANISQGRNTAIEAAASDWVAITDAGVLLDTGWLENLISRRDDTAARVVGGWYEPTWTTKTEHLMAATLMPTLDEIDPEKFLPSSRSILLHRDAWRKAGAYPEWLDYCEDLVFDLRLKEGGEIAFAPRAVARWSARPSWRAYAKQYYRYARGDGKADLWRRRHAARYSAYCLASVVVARRNPKELALLGAGFLAYCGRYFRRAFLRAPEQPLEAVAFLSTVPLVVIVGDLSKMLGYPVGLLWRRNAADVGEGHR